MVRLDHLPRPRGEENRGFVPGLVLRKHEVHRFTPTSACSRTYPRKRHCVSVGPFFVLDLGPVDGVPTVCDLRVSSGSCVTGSQWTFPSTVSGRHVCLHASGVRSFWVKGVDPRETGPSGCRVGPGTLSLTSDPCVREAVSSRLITVGYGGFVCGYVCVSVYLFA